MGEEGRTRGDDRYGERIPFGLAEDAEGEDDPCMIYGFFRADLVRAVGCVEQEKAASPSVNTAVTAMIKSRDPSESQET